MRGRRPTPSRLKGLKGNPGKRRKNRAEPQPGAADVVPPTDLEPLARDVWNRHAPELRALGLLTVLDVVAFRFACEEIATVIYCRKKIQAEGRTTKFGVRVVRKRDGSTIREGGYVAPSVWITIGNRAQSNAIRLLAEFGMTPSARARLTTEPGTPQDPGEKFLEERGV